MTMQQESFTSNVKFIRPLKRVLCSLHCLLIVLCKAARMSLQSKPAVKYLSSADASTMTL